MSSERQPRPFFDRFQKLMDRMETTSVRWWAETIDACRAALVESRAARIDNPHGPGKSAEEAAELERQENELARLAGRFFQLRQENRLPDSSRLKPPGLSLLRTKYSEQVSSYIAVTAAEREALLAELPRAIVKGLSESLDQETIVLRYDALSQCAYHVTRRKGDGLTVWVWSDLGMEAAGQLLSTIVGIEGPMDGSLALDLSLRVAKEP